MPRYVCKTFVCVHTRMYSCGVLVFFSLFVFFFFIFISSPFFWYTMYNVYYIYYIGSCIMCMHINVYFSVDVFDHNHVERNHRCLSREIVSFSMVTNLFTILSFSIHFLTHTYTAICKLFVMNLRERVHENMEYWQPANGGSLEITLVWRLDGQIDSMYSVCKYFLAVAVRHNRTHARKYTFYMYCIHRVNTLDNDAKFIHDCVRTHSNCH